MGSQNYCESYYPFVINHPFFSHIIAPLSSLYWFLIFSFPLILTMGLILEIIGHVIPIDFYWFLIGNIIGSLLVPLVFPYYIYWLQKNTDGFPLDYPCWSQKITYWSYYPYWFLIIKVTTKKHVGKSFWLVGRPEMAPVVVPTAAPAVHSESYWKTGRFRLVNWI